MKTDGGGIAIAVAIVLGVAAGISLFTFRYAEGLSYLSSDPRACANCHVMNEQYTSWQKGPHHGVARCVDCHLPHELAAKLVAKAANGYHHSRAFTLQDFHEPILIKPRNRAILEDNCLRCHGDFVHFIVSDSRPDGDAVQCVRCHRGAGHGARW